MNATINLEKHFPVLLNELVSIISPLYGGTFIDCTFGAGGYTKKILEDSSNNVIALDRDISVKPIVFKLNKTHKKKFKFLNIKFSEINKIQSDSVKAVIFDLGYSLNQISDFNRGLSFKSKGKLDMRMGLNNFTCDDVISNMSQQNLYKIFKFFGDEKYAKPISKKIVEVRENKKIKTENLVEIIEGIKIKNSSRYLPNKITNMKYFNLIEKKPIIPTSEEIKINPPSRSAKLRYAFKIDNGCDFKKFKSKFSYLMEIENLAFND